MKNIVLSPPRLGFVVGTRVAAAFGMGLLASTKFSNSQRRTIGAFLLGLGALTTFPAAFFVLGNRGR